MRISTFSIQRNVMAGEDVSLSNLRVTEHSDQIASEATAYGMIGIATIWHLIHALRDLAANQAWLSQFAYEPVR